MASKCISVGLLLAAETFVMSLWFALAAVLPEMALEADLAPERQALMTSAVQAGFVLGRWPSGPRRTGRPAGFSPVRPIRS